MGAGCQEIRQISSKVKVKSKVPLADLDHNSIYVRTILQMKGVCLNDQILAYSMKDVYCVI